jgi:hypothetical protein
MLYTVGAHTAKEIAARAFGRVGSAVARVLDNTKEIRDEESLADEISAHIQTGYRERVRDTSGMLEELIHKESECRRFNLNPSLQKKAVAAILQKKKHGRNF